MSSPDELAQQLELSTRELEEARAQQTAISDILRAISSSPGDVKPVFDMVAESAARICEAQVVDVMTAESGKLYFSATFGEAGRWERMCR